MNLYLFVSPEHSQTPIRTVWQDNLYHFSIWESNPKDAITLAKSFLKNFNPNWIVRLADNKLIHHEVEEDNQDWN
jgi:hypothetical protein